MSALEIVFWACLGAIAYNYLGYPILLFALSVLSQAKSDLLYLFCRGSRRCAPVTDRVSQTDRLPRVAVLISAYNEESVIEAKVKNSLELDYPADRLECLIGLDAPTDRTNFILTGMPSSQLRVFPFRMRRGKLAVICDLAQRTSADVLVLTDANTILDSKCIRNIVRHFAEPKVGAVTGEEIRIAAPGTDAGAESLYWRYESALKFLESRLNCSLGANGAVLAVRRALFHPTQHSIVEDLQIPLEIRFKGHRVVYDPEVIAIEEAVPTLAAQVARRIRIGAGNYQTLFNNPAYLNPLNGLLAFCFISHKVFRWLAPLLLLIAFFCSGVMAARPEFAVLLMGQCAFYAMAAAGYWCKQHGKRAGMCSLPLHFCAMNFSLLLGLVAYVSGRQKLVWRSTPRTISSGILTPAIGTDDAAQRQILDGRAA